MVSSSSTCAECEVSPATLFCEDEHLLYCPPCSATLHSKKARACHVLTPLRLCDHCETRVALVTCASCGGRGSFLLFCSNCSSDLHSKKARAHHELLPIHLHPPSNDVQQAYHGHGNKSPLSEIHPNKPLRGMLLNDATSGKPTSQRHDKQSDQNILGERNPKREPTSLPHAKSDTNPAPQESSAAKACSHKGKGNQGLTTYRNSTKRPAQDHSSTCTDTSSSGSDMDTSEADETYGTKKYRKGSVTFEAFVVEEHDHEDEHANTGLHPDVGEEQPEGGVQARIRKMLELGLHPDTPDIEAQQALKNAQRLLTKHNLKKADVLMGGLQANTHAFKGGMRMVELRSKDKNKTGRFESWVYSLARTVAKYFDTQYYVQKHEVLKVVFYGIKQNAECAGYAFAATFNRISKLSADYVPSADEEAIKRSKLKANSSQSVYSRVSRMSYRNGLVKGLFEMVKSMKAHQQKPRANQGGREKREKEKRCSSREATEEIVISSSESDSEDSSNESVSRGDDLEDGDEESSGEPGTNMSGAAIHALVLHSKKIAEDFLEENKIKVTTTKLQTPKIWDGEAFLKGKRDSKNIDLGQKGITAKASR